MSRLDILTQNTTAVSEAFTEFNVEVPGSISWHYDEPLGKVYDLYEIAKEKSWNSSKDVNWSSNDHLNCFPVIQDDNPLSGFDGYEALEETEKIRISWWQHALEISEILHGEQGALIIASQLVSCLPSMEAKLFASSQVYDEARHVEFFSRYLKEIARQIHPPSTELKTLINQTIDDPRWDMKFIACQILIESLAMAKFQDLKRISRVPVLQFAVDYIAKDEARHVKFGTEYLKSYMETLPQHELEKRSEFVLDNVLKLANSLNIYTRIADALGWDKNALRFHLRTYRIKNNTLNRNRFRQLVINLSAVGLLTEKAKTRLNKMNLLT